MIVNQTSWYRVLDLTTGETDLVDLPPYGGTPIAMSWTPDGRIAVDVFGRATSRRTKENPPPTISWTIDPDTGDSGSAPLTGVTAPGGGISAPYPTDDEPVRAVPFETATGTDPDRALPQDLYPDGAVVIPGRLGRQQPAGRRGRRARGQLRRGAAPRADHLPRPSRGRSGPTGSWCATCRTAQSISVAVDLVPDLDGTSAQLLTHDFDAPASDDLPGAVPYVLGGLMALLAGLAFVRMLRARA